MAFFLTAPPWPPPSTQKEDFYSELFKLFDITWGIL